MQLVIRPTGDREGEFTLPLCQGRVGGEEIGREVGGGGFTRSRDVCERCSESNDKEIGEGNGDGEERGGEGGEVKMEETEGRRGERGGDWEGEGEKRDRREREGEGVWRGERLTSSTLVHRGGGGR